MSAQIRAQGDRVHLSSADSSPDRIPFRTAIVEARGGLLRWDPTDAVTVPDADVDDVDAAAVWLAEIYGPEVADAVSRGTDATLPVGEGDPAVIDAVLRLGHLAWAGAWWPAGSRVPALDPALLAAETALTTHIVEHLLDDDQAVERALADAATAPAALAAVPSALAIDADRMLSALSALAEDYGVVLDATPGRSISGAREEWALAAGGAHASRAGVEVASGSAPVRWTDVPAQTVAAESEARWTIRQHAGAAVLHVEVPAVDSPHAGRSLVARFGPAELGTEVILERGSAMFHGEAEVPASALFLPAADRTLRVHDPLLSAEDDGAPEPLDQRERVLAFAASRLSSPDASLAERVAGARA